MADQTTHPRATAHTLAFPLGTLPKVTTGYQRTIASYRKITLVVNPDASAMVDQVELQQRAENALSMALHHTRQGNTHQALAKSHRAIAALSLASVDRRA